jgi:hypothetical protein
MRNSSFLKLNIALAIALFAAPAFADDSLESEDKNPPKEESSKVKPAHKPRRSPVSSCGLYTNLMYLTGEFNDSKGGDHFVRQGWNLGANCIYNNRSPFSIGIGAQFYLGRFLLTHEDDALKANVSYVEKGFREWISAILDLNGVKLTGTFGMTRTSSGGFYINSLDVNIGENNWLNLTNYAREHVSSTGELGTLEGGVDVRFPFRRNFSISFGVLWQRYSVSVRAKLDDDAKKVLEAFEFDTTKVERDFKHAANFLYMTPGVTWCTSGEKLCTSLQVPWGIFKADKWLGGAVLGTEFKF